MNYDTLYIIDLSPFCHAGNVNKYAHFENLIEDSKSCWKTQVTPAGGISLVFNVIYDILNKGDIIIACDRNPTIKKDMCPGYKESRHHSDEIELQKNVAEYILKRCGFTVVARDGYEADDIIYSYVKKLHDSYDKIYIYTGDTDLDILVDDKVEILPCHSRAKHITKDNYRFAINKNGTILYNTHTILKIIYGDAGDNIPGLPKEMRDKIHTTLLSNEDDYPYMGNKDYVMKLCMQKCPEILYQVENVFPLLVEDLPDEISQPSKDTVIGFGKGMHNKYFKTYNSSLNIDEEVSIMQANGLYEEDDII